MHKSDHMLISVVANSQADALSEEPSVRVPGESSEESLADDMAF